MALRREERKGKDLEPPFELENRPPRTNSELRKRREHVTEGENGAELEGEIREWVGTVTEPRAVWLYDEKKKNRRKETDCDDRETEPSFVAPGRAEDRRHSELGTHDNNPSAPTLFDNECRPTPGRYCSSSSPPRGEHGDGANVTLCPRGSIASLAVVCTAVVGARNDLIKTKVLVCTGRAYGRGMANSMVAVLVEVCRRLLSVSYKAIVRVSGAVRRSTVLRNEILRFPVAEPSLNCYCRAERSSPESTKITTQNKE